MPPRKRVRPNATTMKMVGAMVAAARIAKNLTQKQLASWSAWTRRPSHPSNRAAAP